MASNHTHTHTHTHTLCNNYIICIHTLAYLLTHTHTPVLRHRAKIEKDYGEKLMNLAKTAAGKDEIG